MNLEQEITASDAKSSGDMGSIYSRYCDDDLFVRQIIEMAQREPLQKDATWLLKQHFENGHRIDEGQVTNIAKLLPDLTCWETKLHILQCLPYITIPSTEKIGIERFLRTCLVDTNKFVRAWAYNGFYELALQHPEYIAETKHFFELAMKDEAASVKARIRNILKKTNGT